MMMSTVGPVWLLRFNLRTLYRQGTGCLKGEKSISILLPKWLKVKPMLNLPNFKMLMSNLHPTLNKFLLEK